MQLLALLMCAAADYVDPQVCATCHREIAAEYAKTGMGRSFFRPSPADTGSYYHALSDTHFSMTVRDGAAYQRRWQLGFDGRETNVEELKVDYVMGSGNHARSYLHRTPRGTLIELPLGWYSENGGQWRMAPGSDSEHPRTRRFISYRCMSCHNANPQIPAGHEASDSDPVFTGELPEGIDCQRCHGPGAKHVQVVRTKGSTAKDVQASIVNPSRLSTDRRMEVCLQCHLETTSGPIPSAIVRFNRGPFSFTPGEPLQDFLLTFDHEPGTGHEGKFEAVGSTYRLRQSQCFKKSAGKMTCETCHNPHRPAAAMSYDASCRQCHANVAAKDHAQAANCAGCHMPKRRAEDTPGMVMTDHLIQRGPPPATLTAEFREKPQEDYRGAVVPYYPATAPTLYAAAAQIGLKNNLAALPVYARAVAAQKPANAEFYSILGDGLLATGKRQEAIAAYTRAIELNPKSVALLRSLAAVSDAKRAVELLAKALQIAPNDPITWYKIGLLESSPEKIRKAIELDPSLPEQSRSLAEILAKNGRRDEAQAALKDALRIDPYDGAAWNLQARVLAERGEMAEAAFSFERAIRLVPREAAYLYDYALALARTSRFDEAFARVQAALQLKPDLAAAHELVGGLYEQKQDWPQAAKAYRRYLELDPTSSRVRERLAKLPANP